MNGLTAEMREVVTMCKPMDLPEMIATAYQMESSSLHSVVQKEMQNKVKATQSATEKSKSYSAYHPYNGWKQKPQPSSPQKQQWKPTTNQRPRVRLTEAQREEKRRLGLCYKCDEKWSRQHVCPNGSLQVLTLIDGVEMELIDNGEKRTRKMILCGFRS